MAAHILNIFRGVTITTASTPLIPIVLIDFCLQIRLNTLQPTSVVWSFLMFDNTASTSAAIFSSLPRRSSIPPSVSNRVRSMRNANVTTSACSMFIFNDLMTAFMQPLGKSISFMDGPLMLRLYNRASPFL